MARSKKQKAKARPAKAKKSKSKLKAKAKAKPAKVKAKKAKAKPMATAKAKPAKATPAKAKPAKAAPAKATPAQPTPAQPSSANVQPFGLVESSPGKFSLLLTEFDGPAAVFAAHDLEAGGYAWEGVARQLLATDAKHLSMRLGLDPEASMFCAYGEDRAALEELGTMLAALYADHAKLAATIEAAGPGGFDD